MDDILEFERRQRSFDLIGQHRLTLAAEATRIARMVPSARMVGVIIERDAPEAATFVRSLAPDSPPVDAFVGVIPRKYALDLLEAKLHERIDWFEDEVDSPVRMLPILVVTKTGYRTSVAEYDAGV